MSTLDLNKKRAARREAAGETLKVTIGDDTFELPPELPLDLAQYMQALTGRRRLRDHENRGKPVRRPDGTIHGLPTLARGPGRDH